VARMSGKLGGSDRTAIRTHVCIAGGGPAGMMLGLLLARAGIEVIVLEKHQDFFRDFRGDTIHPSTLDLIDQLGLRQEFDAAGPNSLARLDMVIKGVRVTPIDFSLLKHGNNRLAFMPQWDFLDVLSAAASKLPTFTLMMETEAIGLLRDGDRVTGVVATTPDGPVEIDAALTVAADGRGSTLRAASGLPVSEFGVPIDVLWFRLARPAVNPPDTLIYITDASMLITIPRGEYYQTAMLIKKGSFGDIKAAGLNEFRATISGAAPFLEPVVAAVTDWDDVKLLSVQINRLSRWYLPGFLAIGDAAHAMSPAFGVGINYAIQDAVATANLLLEPLLAGTPTVADLARVQKRRARPARRMQSLQLRLHTIVARPGGGASLPSPRLLRVVFAIVLPLLRQLIARFIGRGFRPERIRPDILR
jgi:2-polyprenyl-6-methoxyphenol hydroxylase-like FAD-dependent oxidoreductase